MRRFGSPCAVFALVLWVVTVAVGRTPAQAPGNQEGPPTTGVLSEDGLSRMLTDMGYEPKKLKQGYVVAIKHEEWTYNVQCVISPNREKIGLNANVGTVEDPSTVTATQWMNVLAANTDVAPSFFYYNKNNRILYMHRVVDNRCLTTAILSRQIEAFTTNIKDTAEVWKFTK
jgi:hypothetical protein